LKCVVLSAGKGHRILPHSIEVPKVMIPINNKPTLGHVIDYWKKYTNDFVFVVGYKKEKVIDYVKNLSINAEFVEQKKLNGIASALLLVEELVPKRFLVTLGDCLYDGGFNVEDGVDQCVGVYKTKKKEEIKLNYSVEIGNDNYLSKVVEKPKVLVNDLCGMGVYLFKNKVFDYIRKTPASDLRNEVEITDVIENMIEGGEKIAPAFFDGNYINLTYPEDIKKAENIFH
jgi:glucose-1-phosphate thymidylyltransferase